MIAIPDGDAEFLVDYLGRCAKRESIEQAMDDGESGHVAPALMEIVRRIRKQMKDRLAAIEAQMRGEGEK